LIQRNFCVFIHSIDDVHRAVDTSLDRYNTSATEFDDLLRDPSPATPVRQAAKSPVVANSTAPTVDVDSLNFDNIDAYIKQQEAQAKSGSGLFN
jgi:hypothetical protein